jgi:hypothetical protein
MSSVDATRETWEGKRIARLRALVFALGFGMALLSVLVLWRQQNLTEHNEDPFSFAKIASSFIHGDGMVLHIPTSAGIAPHRARRGPAYPLFIAGIFTIGGENKSLVQFAHTLLVGGICVLIFEISRRVFNNLRASLIAPAMYAFHPMILRYAPDIQLEVLLTFFYVLAAFLSLRFIDRPSLGRGFCLGLGIAAAALTKGVALPYSLLFVAAYLVMQWLKRRASTNTTHPQVPWLPLGAIFVGMAVLILPWTYRNYRVLDGHFVLISTNGGGEFIRGYIFCEPDYFLLRKGATTDAESRANQMELDLFAAQGKVWEADEVENDIVLSHAARDKLLSEPLTFVKKTFINSFMYWYVATTKTNSLLVGSLAVLGWILAFVGMKRARIEHVEVWPVLVPILSLNLTYGAVLALARYSAPVIPLLMILSGYGIDALLRRRARAQDEQRPLTA